MSQDKRLREKERASLLCRKSAEMRKIKACDSVELFMLVWLISLKFLYWVTKFLKSELLQAYNVSLCSLYLHTDCPIISAFHMLVLLSYDTWESGCRWLLFLGSWLFSPGAFLLDRGEGIRKIVFFHVAEFVVQSLSHVRLLATPWTAAQQASLSFTVSWSLLKLMSIESVMPSNHLILYLPLLLLPSIFPSIRVFPNELALCIRWPKY